MTTRNISIALGVLLVVALAAWQYSVRQHRAERQAIAALAANATAQLRNSLTVSSGNPIRSIESDLESLRGMRVSYERAAASAAEEYLVSARAIAQRRADALRLSSQVSASN